MQALRVLITGAGGMLGQALSAVLAEDHFAISALTRSALDITDPAAVREAARALMPQVVINCAAYTRVDDAETEKMQAYRTNAIAAAQLARTCREIGARYVYPSSDYVFDGSAHEPYAPTAPTGPVSVYGRSKLAGEHSAREAGDYLIVRTGWLYGPGGRNFVRTIADKARHGERLRVVSDQRGAPTWTFDLARMLSALLEHGAPSGTYHASNRGSTTWYDLALATTSALGIPATIEPCTSKEFGARAPRPAYSVLDCSATEPLVGPIRDWQSALHQALQSGAY